VIDFKHENEKGKTFIYIPAGTSKEDAQEFFTVHGNILHSNADPVEMQLAVTNMTTNPVNFQMLEQVENSMIYEWGGSISERDPDEIHGWRRTFSSPNGTIMLSYLTKDLSNIEQARSIRLPVLQAAESK